ncbi:MAG: heavy metal translocating P-type ATPase [Desulfamplus sp.]|nr:heavy metal translocating P-type ATPase [Desulfamplus sp.]
MLPAIFAAGTLIYGGKKLLEYLKPANQNKSFENNQEHNEYLEKKDSGDIIKKTNGDILKENNNIVVKAALINKNDHTNNDNQNLAEIEKNLNISLASTAFAGAGKIFYSSFTPIGSIGLGYITLLEINKAYKILKEEKRLSVEFINSLVAAGLLATGYIFTAGFTFSIYYVGQKLIQKAQNNNKKELTSIFQNRKTHVWLVVDGNEIEIPIDSLKYGDIISVKAGETIPVDGVVSRGNGVADQHILTGESKPSEKGVGDTVFASTVLLSGKIYVKVEKSGKETIVSNIEHVLKQTVDFKTDVQSRGEALSQNTILPTLALSAAALPIAGTLASLSVLYSYVGYDICVFAPLSMVNFMKVAYQNGILIKDGRAMELLYSVDTVVFDKTGTLTLEQPHVWKIHPCSGYEENKILEYAATAEHRQTHPVAKAILSKAKEYNFLHVSSDDVSYDIGYGITFKTKNDTIRVGSARFMKMEEINIPSDMEELMQSCNHQGYSLVMVARNNHLAGAIELHTSVRPEAKAIIKYLKKRNKEIYIISGDETRVAKELADDLGIENYFADAFPEQKSDIIAQLQKEGKKICFIGDGINDSIAMKRANVSVSMSGASQIATDTADIILMDGSLRNLDKLFDLSDNINKNLNVAITAAVVPGVLNIGSVSFDSTNNMLYSHSYF